MATYKVTHPNGITVSAEDEDDEAEFYEEGEEWNDPPESVLAAFGDRLEEVDTGDTVGVSDEDAHIGPRGTEPAGEPVDAETLEEAEQTAAEDDTGN